MRQWGEFQIVRNQGQSAAGKYLVWENFRGRDARIAVLASLPPRRQVRPSPEICSTQIPGNHP
jgi:hypothetical protein